MTSIGDRLRALRGERGLTLAQAGEAARMSRSVWHDYESGRRPNPTLAVVVALAGALDVEPSELLEGLDEFPGD